MINANDLLRTIKLTKHNLSEDFNHKKLTDLLVGMKGTFTKKHIQFVRKVMKDELTSLDDLLAKLENE